MASIRNTKKTDGDNEAVDEAPVFWKSEPWRSELSDTVYGHLSFYQNTATSCQKHAHLAATLILVMSAAIPVVVAAGLPAYIAALLGGLIAVTTGLTKEYQWKENWLRENRTLVAMQEELVWYRNDAGPYTDQPFEAKKRLLSLRIEQIVQSDGRNWDRQVTRVEPVSDPDDSGRIP